MFTQHDFRILWKQVQPYRAYIPSLPVLSAGVIAILGAGLLLALPDASNESATASTASETQAVAFDESGCDKQTWPYVDQRCAQRAEKARESRKVRVVTDRGTDVTVVTPVPVVAPKPAQQNVAVAPQPAPVSNPAPVQQAAAPAPAPQVQPGMAPAAPPAASNKMAMAANPSMAPPQASPAPVAPGIDALGDASGKKSKAQKRAEKRDAREAKRETKRQREIATDDSGVPEDLVATVKSLPADGASRRKARRGVPDEVIAAVEEAAARDRGAGYGGRRVIILNRGEW